MAPGVELGLFYSHCGNSYPWLGGPRRWRPISIPIAGILKRYRTIWDVADIIISIPIAGILRIEYGKDGSTRIVISIPIAGIHDKCGS